MESININLNINYNNPWNSGGTPIKVNTIKIKF